MRWPIASDAPERYRARIASQGDVARIVAKTRAMAAEAGFDALDAIQLATAVSEIATNVVRYAVNGTVELGPIADDGRRGIEVRVVDNGPGIDNIERAMVENYSSGGSLGLGLSGARRMVDEMTIDSSPGKGTRVLLRKRRLR